MNPVHTARLQLVFWLLLAAAFYSLSFGFADEAGTTFEWGPAAWPRAAALLMAAAAVANYLANRPVAGSGAAAAGTPADWTAGWNRGEILSVAGMVAIPLVYTWLIPRAGFYISTLLFLPAYMRLLGECRWWMIATVTVLLFALVNLVFTVLFYAGLPTGRWPGFYEASSWFVTVIR